MTTHLDRTGRPSPAAVRSLRLLVALVAGLSGCASRQAIRVPITDVEVLAGTTPAVHVENWRGDVRVEVHSGLAEPQVRAVLGHVRQPALGEGEGDRPGIWVAAEATSREGYSVLRVLAQPEPGADERARARLVVRMPACHGTLVRTSDGQVMLIGVEGSVQVENGLQSGRGGRVEVRTDRPITEPVLIATASGDIHYQVGPGSAGDLDLSTGDGQIVVFARKGQIRDLREGRTRWTGNFNEGRNPVVLRTASGRVTVAVIDRARDTIPLRRPFR